MAQFGSLLANLVDSDSSLQPEAMVPVGLEAVAEVGLPFTRWTQQIPDSLDPLNQTGVTAAKMGLSSLAKDALTLKFYSAMSTVMAK